jgi:hypothetical protein
MRAKKKRAADPGDRRWPGSPKLAALKSFAGLLMKLVSGTFYPNASVAGH